LLILSVFNTETRMATLKEDWDGKWFSIAAQLFPNELISQAGGFSGC
jgi:hypothetical protein